MRTFLNILLLVLLSFTSLAAQQAGQQGLTDGMIATAAREVPRLVELLELKPGMTIADVAGGFGAWTTAFAKWTGPSGRVYSTEIGQKQLDFLRETVTREKLTNVTVLEGAERSANLPAGCCDAILIRDAFHHFTQPADMLRSVVASLKPGGRLAVIDFPPRSNSGRPQGVPANRIGHGVPPSVVIEEVTAAGLTLVRQDPQWSPQSQPSGLFLIVFRKAN
jgi:predicted methyltransferase